MQTTKSNGGAEPNNPMHIYEVISRLSGNTLRAYNYIARTWLISGGHFPTMDEIAEHLDISKSNAWYFVDKLVDSGLVVRRVGTGRRSGLYSLAGAIVSVNEQAIVTPGDRAFRNKPGRVAKNDRKRNA